MNTRTPITVIDLDRDRLTALWATPAEKTISVRGMVCVPRPESVAMDSASAVGRWVRGVLEKAEIPRTKVVLSLPRGEVVIKRLSLPAGGLNDADLGGAVRLQMARQVTMPMEGTAVDYIKLADRSPGAAAPGQDGPAGTSVMAAALPADRLAWCKGLADAGEFTLQRIGLRGYGAAAVLAELSHRRTGPILGVALGWNSAEFLVIDDGHVLFARAADIPRPGASAGPDRHDEKIAALFGGDPKPADDPELDAYAEKIAVEAKRTWMSHRATHGGAEVESVAVLGDDAVSRAAADRSAVQVGCAAEVVASHHGIEFAPGIAPADRASALPLVGLLLEPHAGPRTLDFANPRKAPDLGAARRTKILLGVLGSILLAGGSAVLGMLRLAGLEDQVRSTNERRESLQREYSEFLVQHARAAHLEQWTSAKVDWLSYLAVLNDQFPAPDAGMLDRLGAHVESVPRYDSRNTAYPEGTWRTNQAAAFAIDGRMSSRAVAADLRGKLLDLNFDNVENKGPDVPDRFSFWVTTSKKAPPAPGSEKKSTEPAPLGTPADAAKTEGGVP